MSLRFKVINNSNGSKNKVSNTTVRFAVIEKKRNIGEPIILTDNASKKTQDKVIADVLSGVYPKKKTTAELSQEAVNKTTIPHVDYDEDYVKNISQQKVTPIADIINLDSAKEKYKKGEKLSLAETIAVDNYSKAEAEKTGTPQMSNVSTLEELTNTFPKKEQPTTAKQALANAKQNFLNNLVNSNAKKFISYADEKATEKELTYLDKSERAEYFKKKQAGEIPAQQYLDGKRDKINMKKGLEIADEYINGDFGDKLSAFLYSAWGTGSIQAGNNLVNFGETLTEAIGGNGNIKKFNTTPAEYANAYLANYFTENDKKVEKAIQDVVVNIANNVTLQGAGMLTGSKFVTLAPFAMSIFSGAYQEEIKNGYSSKDATKYALATTAAETAGELAGFLISGMPTLKGFSGDAIVEKIIKNIKSAFLRGVTKLGFSTLGETAEESFQFALDPYLRNWILKEDNDTILNDWENQNNDLFYSGLIGGVSALLMGSISTMSEIRTQKDIENYGKMCKTILKKTDVEIKDVAKFGLQSDKNSDLYETSKGFLDGTLKETDYNVGKLFKEANDFIGEANNFVNGAYGQKIMSEENGVENIVQSYDDMTSNGAQFSYEITNLAERIKNNLSANKEINAVDLGKFARGIAFNAPTAQINGELKKVLPSIKNETSLTTPTLTENEQELINTPDEQLTPEQKAVKQNIIERNNSVLNNDENSGTIKNDNKANLRGENNGSTDSELLERTNISTVSGDGNNIREQNNNSKKLSQLLGRNKSNGTKVGETTTAGESGFLSIYKGHSGKHDIKSGQDSRRFWENHVRNLQRIKLKPIDSVGRVLSDELQKKLSDSVFKSDDGTIISFFHWTQEIFDKFAKGDIGFHFGTLDAASAIQFDKSDDNGGYFKEVFLNIKNPVFLESDPMRWTALTVTEYLYREGIFTEEDYNHMVNFDPESFNKEQYDSKSLQEIRKLLDEKGYDGIIYTNDWEGGLSVIALYPEQIITIAENGVLKENSGVTEADPNGPANFIPKSQNGKGAQSDVDQEITDNDMYSKDPSQWNAENKNDTTVSKSLKEKLAELFGKPSNKKPPSISEIVKQIEQDFNVPVSKGKFKQKAYGIYKQHAQAIRTKISNALPTIAHELGHHLDYKYNLRHFESIGELERVLKETRPNFYNAYKPEARPGEAVAEFMRDYLADRKLAKEKYPFFYEEFERKLSESGSQGQKDLQNLKIIGDKINEYYSTELRERAKASIVTRKEAKKINRMGVKLDDILLKVKTEMFDDAAIFKKISQKAYDLYYWAKKSSVRAKNTLSGWYMPGFKEDIVKLKDKNGNFVKDENGNDVYVPALKFILSEIESGQMFEDFNEYLVLKHGMEWLDNDLRVFADDALNNKKYMSETISQLEKSYPQFKEVSENLYDWYRTFVYEYGVNSGLMTKEQYKSLVEKYPCYVPFMRNVQKQNAGVRASVGNQNAPIKKAKGSGLEILNPIESIVVKVEQFMKAADRNAVMQEITNTIDSEEGFGWLLEQVPPDMVPTTISSELIKNKAKKTLEDSGMDENAVDEFSHLIDVLIGDSITDFNIGTFQGENVVAVRRNGKRTLYQVHDKNMLAALTGLNPDQFGVITKAFGKLTRLFKALTTGSNAVWSLVSNAPRDFDSAYKYGSENNPIRYTVDYIKAVGSQMLKKDSETMKLYRTLGGGYNNSFSNARELQLTTKNLIANDKGFADRVKALFNIVENIAKLADFVETAPRLAEFKRVYERTGDAKKAMLAAEEVTVNFNRSGKFSKTLDQYLPYFNASLQANAKYAKTIAKSFSKEGDKSFLVKSILTAILKTGIMFGILGLFGEEGEEEYEKLSAYKKNNFYNIYLGNGKFFSIPKSQSTGVFDSLLERTFEISRKEDVDWAQEIKDFAGYMWLTFGPPLVDDMIVGSTIYDLAKNEDFTGAPIVSSYYEDLEPEMQYNEKTTYIAKAIGQLFGWSPMKIDHIIESNLGVFGLLNKSLGRPEKDLTLGVETKIFTDNAYSTDILNNFYDKADAYSSKAKSYPDNAEYVYKNKQYESVKSIVSALNSYGKEDPELARDFKILARDYVEKFEKESKVDNKLLKLLEKTGEKDILYYRNFEPTYTINKTTYKMEPEDFMNLVSEYYDEIEKEYEEIFEMGLSDESTTRLLIQIKKNVYNRISKPYKTKKQ
jgi:hypothetical protein